MTDPEVQDMINADGPWVDDRVERVARAIAGEAGYDKPWEAFNPSEQVMFIEAARAAIAAADAWRPIETAPKDGASILVADARGRVHEANWQNEWYGDESNPGWMPANLDEEYGSYIAAVAWMPMPRAPEAK